MSAMTILIMMRVKRGLRVTRFRKETGDLFLRKGMLNVGMCYIDSGVKNSYSYAFIFIFAVSVYF
jgi:hypothetical protein